MSLVAAALKEKGNHAFSKGDYGTAVQRYTEGLEKRKDMPELYTNRAQVSCRAFAAMYCFRCKIACTNMLMKQGIIELVNPNQLPGAGCMVDVLKQGRGTANMVVCPGPQVSTSLSGDDRLHLSAVLAGGGNFSQVLILSGYI